MTRATLARLDAPGRLAIGSPIAIVDVGSNSVRLVVYEGLTRAPTPIFNDKYLCGLGRGVALTKRLPEDAVAKALSALKRFRILCQTMEVGEIHVLATAAVRDADNGPAFLAEAEAALGAPVSLLSGQREAELTSLGIVSGIWKADGVVGDLGGGSLELNDIKGATIGEGVSLPIGGLALMDMSGKSLRRASKIVRDMLVDVPVLNKLEGRSFYAVGGTWRALAKLHMHQRNYPLNVMHNYVIPASEAADFAELVERIEAEALVAIESVSTARRPLLAYGAVVLDEIIRRAGPKDIVISALGVREGLLYERLTADEAAADPLIEAARDLNILRSRAPQHGEELFAWTSAFWASTHLDETEGETRLRHAACLLADIGWRAHPDYRGEQSLNVIANAAFVGVDHPGRAFLALAASYRHMGPDGDVSPQIRPLLTPRLMDRAHILGAAMRVAYVISAAMPGILPQTPMICHDDKVAVTLPGSMGDLASDRLTTRLRQLGRLIGREAVVRVA